MRNYSKEKKDNIDWDFFVFLFLVFVKSCISFLSVYESLISFNNILFLIRNEGSFEASIIF